MQGRGGQAPGTPNDFRPPGDQGNFRPPFGADNFPGGPGMMMGRWNWVPTAALLSASLGALASDLFRRKSLTSRDIAVIAGCALGLLLVSLPWVAGDIVM